MTKQAIFIHSLFRTGSTYIWNIFRRDDRFFCYYEPFHQDIAKLNLSRPSPWSFNRQTTQAMGHPDLDRDYMYEYRNLLNKDQDGIPLFRKSFSFDDFCHTGEHPEQKAYIDLLIGNAGSRIPVLQFNRSAIRIRWFKHYYPGAPHIYLLRNPEEQFLSYYELHQQNNLDIFFVMDMLTASVNISRSPLFSHIAERVHLFEFHSDSIDEEILFYRQMLPLYSLREKFFIFYYIWFASLVENSLYADRIISMDLLSADEQYRRRAVAWLAEHGAANIDFSDANIKKRNRMICEEDDMTEIKETVEMLILRQYSREDAEKAFNRLKAGGEDGYYKMTLSRWLEMAEKRLQAIPQYHIRIQKYMMIIENFFQSILEKDNKGGNNCAEGQKNRIFATHSRSELLSPEKAGAFTGELPDPLAGDLLKTALGDVYSLPHQKDRSFKIKPEGLQKISLLLANERNNFLLMEELLTKSIYAYHQRSQELDQKNTDYEQKVRELADRDNQINQLLQKNAEMDGSLRRILNSKGYRLLRFLHKPFRMLRGKK